MDTGSARRHVTIQSDLACTACGYNLRGLARNRSCPECGAPIEHSTRGVLLKYSDPRWLAAVRRGITLTLWTIPLRAALLSPLDLPPPFAHTLAVLATVLCGLGALWLCAREPRAAHFRSPVPWRGVVAVCAVLEMGGGLIPVVVLPTPYLHVATWLCAVSFATGLIARLQYLHRYDHRIPDADLVLSTAVLLWLICVAMLCMVPLVLLTLFRATSRFTPLPAGLLWGVLITAALLWIVIALFRYLAGFRRGFQEAGLVAIALAEDPATRPHSPPKV